MASEDQDILAKINLLRGTPLSHHHTMKGLKLMSGLIGQINQHKGQPVDDTTPFHPTTRTQTHANAQLYNYSSPGSDSYLPANRGYGRGAYAGRASSTRGRLRGRGGAPIHRNRTLILNGNAPVDATSATPISSGSSTPPVNAQGWISKTDRHLQLINPSIFEKDSQRRAKAMEETRQLKLKQRDLKEQNKFNKHLHRVAGTPYTSEPSSDHGNYEVTVQGIRFRVVKGGGKLVKVPGEDSRRINGQLPNTPINFNVCLPCPGDLNAAKSTPKTALIGGVKFHRSTHGNMYRAGIIKAHRYGWQSFETRRSNPYNRADWIHFRRTAAVKKINEPCKVFSTTGTSFLSPFVPGSALLSLLFVLEGTTWLKLTILSPGSCPKGPRCRYVHDPAKVAVCKEFLLKGSCPSGDSCDLSHELTPERTPSCLHFSKGKCSNPSCRYIHVRVSPAALVCRSFAIYGFCEKGSSCAEKHVYECPDFSNTGTCAVKGCKLPHRHKASVLRNITNVESAVAGEDSDISSDEEDEEIDSEDVDSDDLDEEFFGRNEEDDEDGAVDISAQQDFVQLR